MSTNNHIKTLLHIQDENITFKDDCVWDGIQGRNHAIMWWRNSLMCERIVEHAAL